MEINATVCDDEGEVHEGEAADNLLVAELLSQRVLIFGRDYKAIVVRLLWPDRDSGDWGQQWVGMSECRVFIRRRFYFSHRNIVLSIRNTFE